MENLAETLGSRPERKPLYGIDDSDDEPSMVSMKSQDIEETFERIVRSDAVLFPSSFLFIYLFLCIFIFMLKNKFNFVLSASMVSILDWNSIYSLIRYSFICTGV